MSNKLSWLSAAASLFVATSVLAGADNVAFPKDYKETFKVIAVRDMHNGGNAVAVVYANKIAVDSAKKGGELASGSVFLMEVWRAKMDGNDLARDAKDRLVPDVINVINMMEKRDGWGVGYPAEWRNGNWEYASFTADRAARDVSLQTCFDCHKTVGDAGFDFAFVVAEMR